MAIRERGVYELLITEQIEEDLLELQALRTDLSPSRTGLHQADAADRIAFHISRIIEGALRGLDDKSRVDLGSALARRLIDVIGAELPLSALALTDLRGDRPTASAEVLRSLRRFLPNGVPEEIPAPKIPLLDTTLLTNAPGEPRVGHQILEEIRSADGIDAVLAFIRHSGIAPLLDALRKHCEAGRPLRVLTTSYTQSTEPRALDELTALGAKVRVSYDESSTRLHAKAWLFHRASGFSTAYIGSSNLTHSAQVSGLEWNVRVAKARNLSVVEKVEAVFESYWESPDFVAYKAEEYLARTQRDRSDGDGLLLSVELRAEPFQERMLEQIALARAQGHHRNLIVSATGTGKTVMAALDYANLRATLPRARLLFVAHREEILARSQATFRVALRQASFGELWVAGKKPAQFEHVFASIQSLHEGVLPHLDPNQFDVVIVDEFHHAEAKTYRALLDRLHPIELLGLTATPERSDGLSVSSFFDGRIAAELRLWDAIDQHRLAPFAYYGIFDGLDLTKVPWTRGRGYQVEALSNLITGNELAARAVVQETQRLCADWTRMRALGFCVSVDHARFMARIFQEAGIAAVAIWGETPDTERRAALDDLASGEVKVVFSVDLFNEGIDLPNVDTLLMLRPTESATLFLQQLGRGLRKSPGKSLCTVLDFVGTQHKEFRFDRKLRALLGGTRKDVIDGVEQGFPFLPAGCHMQLDKQSQRVVLESLKNAIPSRRPAMIEELRSLSKDGACSLARFLQQSGLELEDIYSSKSGWSDLVELAGSSVARKGPHETELRRACGRVLHIDDRERLDAYSLWLAQEAPPDAESLSVRDARLLRMLIVQLFDQALSKGSSLSEGVSLLWQHPQILAELRELFACLLVRIDHVAPPLERMPDVPLRVHARYTRLEMFAAFGVGSGATAPTWQSGMYWAEEAKSDLFAFTLDKTSGGFSPTTRYKDYAVNQELIHWETQGRTRESHDVGQRIQRHEKMGTHVMLFARAREDQRGFYFLGPASYVEHKSEKPMQVIWKLAHRLPADLFTAFAAAVA
jgi:superfamily II DNA or RNA helicase